MRFLIIALLLVVLAGCSIGIRDDGRGAVHTAFHAPISYQEAYRRADAYARYCRTSTNWFKGSFQVSGNLYQDNQTGVVHITPNAPGKDMERIEISAAKDGGSNVTVTAWNVGMWDDQEIAAARRSIETGTLACRSGVGPG